MNGRNRWQEEEREKGSEREEEREQGRQKGRKEIMDKRERTEKKKSMWPEKCQGDMIQGTD